MHKKCSNLTGVPWKRGTGVSFLLFIGQEAEFCNDMGLLYWDFKTPVIKSLQLIGQYCCVIWQYPILISKLLM